MAHPVEIGVFVKPEATASTMQQILAAERFGLDVLAVQDHPYQRRFYDMWTLLAFAAGRTSRLMLLPDVACLPLRPPPMLAKAAASLDVLSGGRVELGLGAGAFWPAISAMGGPSLSPKESVDRVVEAIAILRSFWDDQRSISHHGAHYTVHGLRPGPPPAHRIGVWIGAEGPRMMQITGRLADGWLPSLGERLGDRKQVLARHATIDDAARSAGRDPSDVRRAVNIFQLDGRHDRWAQQIADVVASLRFTTILVGVPDDDPVTFVQRLGEDVAPEVRRLISSEPGAPIR